MDIKYTDQQIAELINERKVLPDDWRPQLDKNNSLYIIGESGNRFRIITNLNEKYPSDFSVILAVITYASTPKTFWNMPNTQSKSQLSRTNKLLLIG